MTSDRLGLTDAQPRRTSLERTSEPASRDRRTDLLGLQRQAGNRAVLQRAAQLGLMVQRDDPPSAAPAAAPALLLGQSALLRSEAIRAAATVRLAKLALYNSTADTALSSYQDMRTRYATRWGAAWDRHATVLSDGGKQAGTQNLIEGVVIGAVAAVLISAAAAAVFTTAAAAKVTTGTFWAFNIATNTTSSLAGAGIATAVGRPSVPGPTSGRRDEEANAWRRVAELERSARTVASLAPGIGLELGNAEYCIAQVRSHLEQGRGDMTWDQTLNMTATLSGWETRLAPFDAELDQKTAAMAAFGAAAQAFEVPSIQDLEKEIWYSWMSTLDNASDEALDQDHIQQHLVGLHLIPDHFYMTDQDQHDAVAAARAHVSALPQP